MLLSQAISRTIAPKPIQALLQERPTERRSRMNKKVRRRVGQGLLRAPSPSKNRTCEFPRIRLKPFCRPITRPGCWVVRVVAFHGREFSCLGPSLSPALLPPHPTVTEVAFVRQIELRGFSSHFNMPANRHATRPKQVQVPPGTVPIPHRRREDPLLGWPGAEVSLTHPAFSLMGVSPLCPLP